MPPQLKPKKPGRQKLAKGEAKGKSVPVRFTDDDLKKITAAAKSRNMLLSQWIRETLDAAV